MNQLAPATIDALEEALSYPTQAVIDQFARLDGDLIVLGVAGKMGPSLASMARRATDLAGKPRRIIGVSRFRDAKTIKQLNDWGIETITCDLLNEDAVNTLPDAPNIIYMAGMKFGASGNEPLTWAMNTHLPSIVCRKYRESRIAAFSTGNIYGLRDVATGGSRESDQPNPVGEYAMSCLGRERIFEHFSATLNIPTTLIRLNYACDLRYGVLVDVAQRIRHDESVDLSMSWFNTMWQGDANAYSLLSLGIAEIPAKPLNLTGVVTLRVRDVALQLGERLGKQVSFTGTESPHALINDASQCMELFGPPGVNESQLICMVAAWTMQGGPMLGKPTHFESRDGKF
jgi:hypothetical protein